MAARLTNVLMLKGSPKRALATAFLASGQTPSRVAATKPQVANSGRVKLSSHARASRAPEMTTSLPCAVAYQG